MAREGREPRRKAGGRGWAAGGRGYGWEYRGAERGRRRAEGYGGRTRYGPGEGYGVERGYGIEPGYGERMGYGERAGYGAWMGYGEEFGPRYGYDYEFGGRGWPYREGAGRGAPGYAWRRGGRYGEEYDWEAGGPEDFGMRYGFEYTRPGPPAYRPAWRRARGWRGLGGRERGYEGRYGGLWGGRSAYEAEYAGRAYSGRSVERGYGREEPTAEPRYGHTPQDRWPSEGHDVDERPVREREMSDSEIREAVLENLFQDTWIEPSRIEARVEHGVVTLAGEVADFMEARYAWDDAWESAGVRGVVNNLTVRADRPQPDMELPQTAGGAQQGRGAGR